MRENSQINSLHTADFGTVANQREYFFGQQPLLQDKIVHRLAVTPEGGYTESGLQVPAIIDRAFFEIRDKGGKVILTAPARMFFISLTNPSWDTLPFFKGGLKDIDWQKSRIYFPNGTTVAAGTAISVTFEYA
jgi:hypothetical protein